MKNINPENLSNEMSDALVNFHYYAEKIADLPAIKTFIEAL